MQANASYGLGGFGWQGGTCLQEALCRQCAPQPSDGDLGVREVRTASQIRVSGLPRPVPEGPTAGSQGGS